MKCVNCKHCIGTDDTEHYYLCEIGGVLEAVEECIANDDNMGCDYYVADSDDDYTARCNQRIN